MFCWSFRCRTGSLFLSCLSTFSFFVLEGSKGHGVRVEVIVRFAPSNIPKPIKCPFILLLEFVHERVCRPSRVVGIVVSVPELFPSFRSLTRPLRPIPFLVSAAPTSRLVS